MDDGVLISSQALLGTTHATKKADPEVHPEIQRLDGLSLLDNKPLFVCKSMFPFDLFPDTVTVDRNKITVSKKFFFFSRSVQSIMLSDLLTIVIDETLLFATLRVIDRSYPQDTIVVSHLRKRQASRLRWILEGLIVGKRENIDFSIIPNDQLIPRLIKIGQTKVA